MVARTIDGIVESISNGRAEVLYLDGAQERRASALIGPVRGVRVGARVLLRIRYTAVCVVGVEGVDAPAELLA